MVLARWRSSLCNIFLETLKLSIQINHSATTTKYETCNWSDKELIVKMNNFKRRALIFVTFFGSCLAISLLSAALGTKHWITAKCRRTTEFSDKSYGQVNFGLFNYEANLNFGIGNRTYMENMLGTVTTRMPSKHETFFCHNDHFILYSIEIKLWTVKLFVKKKQA